MFNNKILTKLKWLSRFDKCLFFAGRDDGLNVENLKGSGMIAGEMSAAYNETVTISLVCVTFGDVVAIPQEESLLKILNKFRSHHR